MKKNYMKPEVSEVAVEANQAIAACNINKGVRCSGEYGTFYATPEEAWAANMNGHTYQHTDENGQGTSERDWYPVGQGEAGHDIFPVYVISGTHADGSSWKYWFEDVNGNGIYDSGEQSNNYNDANLIGVGGAFAAVVAS